MKNGATDFVVAVIVAYHRDVELARLLRGLLAGTTIPGAIVVVDNAASTETEHIVNLEAPEAIYLAVPENPGPGTAWRKGCELAMKKWDREITHLLTLDDDVVFTEKTLEDLLAGCRNCDAVVPLLTDHSNHIWGFPEPRDKQQRKLIREAQTPADALALLGPAPQEFCWATGACVLFTRNAADTIGLHGEDFFMLGEDLEWSMRLASALRGAFLPGVVVPHLPPQTASGQPGSTVYAVIKFAALLQNLSYLAFHHRGSAHMKSYLPGNFRRFFKTRGVSGFSILLAVRVFYAGTILGEPAGKRHGAQIREMIRKKFPAN